MYGIRSAFNRSRMNPTRHLAIFFTANSSCSPSVTARHNASIVYWSWESISVNATTCTLLMSNLHSCQEKG